MEVGMTDWIIREDQSEDEAVIDRGLPSHPGFPNPLGVRVNTSLLLVSHRHIHVYVYIPGGCRFFTVL